MNIAVLRQHLESLDRRFCEEAMSERRNLKALVLDLGEETHYEWVIPEQILDSYISGPALGARLWAEFAGSDVEEESTYESNNPIVITASALTNSGIAGCESVSITFRSPVTGRLAFNVVSNSVGMRLDALGYCALVVIGRLRRPTVIDVRKSGVTYNVSEIFIGYTVSQIENLVGVGPMTTALSIGPAGEQSQPHHRYPGLQCLLRLVLRADGRSRRFSGRVPPGQSRRAPGHFGVRRGLQRGLPQ